MESKKVEILRDLSHDLKDSSDYNLDVLVELANGETYTVLVTTSKNLF